MMSSRFPQSVGWAAGVMLAMMAIPGHAATSTWAESEDHAESTPEARSFMPPAALFALRAQSMAPHSYDARRVPGLRGIRMQNTAERFDASFGPNAMVLHAQDLEGWRVTWRLASWSPHGGQLPIPPARPRARRNRVDYLHDGISAWFVNGPLGLEQGFTLHPPPTPHEGPVSLRVAVEGAQVRVQPHGATVLPYGSRTRLIYGPLAAVDADGRSLPCRLGAWARGIEIRVDTEDAAYPIVVDPLITIDDGKLLPSDGGPGDGFGSATSVKGDLAVVGATGHSATLSNEGAAYAYAREGSAWSSPIKLVPADPAANKRFGTSVTVAGDRILVGAHHDATEAYEGGAVYAFERDAGGFSQVQKILPDSAVDEGRFGIAIAASGDTAVVGSRAGAAYMLFHNGTEWESEGDLTASDGVAGAERFGATVAIDEDVVVCGAQRAAEGSLLRVGAAYIYERSGGVWSEVTKLTPPDGEAYDSFGTSVAVHGDYVLVGAPFEDDAGPDAGAVYVFHHDGADWTYADKIAATATDSGDAFGIAVALHGDAAIVGAKDADGVAPGTGAAYLFQLDQGAWTERQVFFASDGAAADSFGRSLGTDGNTALVGVPADDDAGTNSGSAVSFLLRLEDGDPCADAWRCASGFCVDDVCCETACDGGAQAGCQACSAALGSSADGVCGFASSGWPCSEPVCSEPDEWTPASTCDGQGTCEAAEAETCSDGYACDQGACLTTCEDQTDCAPDHRCEPDGTCFALLAQGQDCADPEDCRSGFCVDGVCCDTACEGSDPEDCHACSVQAGASEDGTCEPLDGVSCDEGAGVCNAGTCEPEPDAGSDAGKPDAGAGGAAPDAASDAGGEAPDAAPDSAAGGSSDESGSDDGGCSCRAGSRSGGERSAWWLALLAVAGLGRARRGRRR